MRAKNTHTNSTTKPLIIACQVTPEKTSHNMNKTILPTNPAIKPARRGLYFPINPAINPPAIGESSIITRVKNKYPERRKQRLKIQI